MAGIVFVCEFKQNGSVGIYIYYHKYWRPYNPVSEQEKRTTGNQKSYVNENRPHLIAVQYGLSNREEEVLELMLQGKDNKYISESLFISPNTLRHHISAIYKKTGVDNRVDLIMMNNPQKEK